MTDIHKNFFGQIPTRKRMFDGKLYRQLEIGEMIQEEDILEIFTPPEVILSCDFLAGFPYNPINEHKSYRIWRLINVGR